MDPSVRPAGQSAALPRKREPVVRLHDRVRKPESRVDRGDLVSNPDISSSSQSPPY